jgi:radical S-adenosyl methionine domain-containing protein 2
MIRILADSQKFRKINFAGGEPTLIPHICELIKYAKELGFETSIVTNASRIDSHWVAEISNHLDILALSIDSTSDSINKAIGRHQNNITNSITKLKSIALACHIHGVQLKVNTVVCQENKNDLLVDLINELHPFRWKVLQATRVEGQNDMQFDSMKVSPIEFDKYIRTNRTKLSESIKMIEEPETIIQGSYLMIDMLGRFFDSSQKKHNYSLSILKVGVVEALSSVQVDEHKFNKREGNYSLINKLAS